MILRSRDLLFLSLMYFCYGWVFWMYLSGCPRIFPKCVTSRRFKMGLAASLPLLAATIMNIDRRLDLRQAGPDVGRLRRGRSGGRRGRVRARRRAQSSPACWRNNADHRPGLPDHRAGRPRTDGGGCWAICLDIAGDFSGSVTGVMNTLGNLGGAVSAVVDRLSGDDLRMDRAISRVQRRCAAWRRCPGHADRPEPFGRGRIPSGESEP